MSGSRELRIGTAAEHLVAADLLLQGYDAWLAPAGVPYDVVVDVKGSIKRVQVKATVKLRNLPKQGLIYRFGTRAGRHGYAASADSFDYYAFVALDVRAIGYLDRAAMIARTGGVKQTVDFKSRLIKYPGRIYSNGTQRAGAWGRQLQDFSRFV